jgi:hypothetical protein
MGGGRKAGRASEGDKKESTRARAHRQTVMRYLVFIYQNQGRWEEAKKLEAQVVKTGKTLGSVVPSNFISSALNRVLSLSFYVNVYFVHIYGIPLGDNDE